MSAADPVAQHGPTSHDLHGINHLVTELADQSYVGTALTLQMAFGFLLTGATIWLIPVAEQLVGWQWAFAVLAVGPLAGIMAMQRLRRLRQPVQLATW